MNCSAISIKTENFQTRFKSVYSVFILVVTCIICKFVFLNFTVYDIVYIYIYKEIMIPTAISLLIFDMEVPIRLNEGKAYSFRFAHDILHASIAYAFLSGFHNT